MEDETVEKKKDKDKEFEDRFERAVEHYLNKKYAQFGRWTLGIIGTMIFLALVQLIFWLKSSNGTPSLEHLPLKELMNEVN